MKERWSSDNDDPPPSQLTAVEIFDRVEVANIVLSRRSRAEQQSMEQSREKLIAETAGPEPTDTHLPPWE
eukprot:3486073-Rhodomonas_salina.1